MGWEEGEEVGEEVGTDGELGPECWTCYKRQSWDTVCVPGFKSHVSSHMSQVSYTRDLGTRSTRGTPGKQHTWDLGPESA